MKCTLLAALHLCLLAVLQPTYAQELVPDNTRSFCPGTTVSFASSTDGFSPSCLDVTLTGAATLVRPASVNAGGVLILEVLVAQEGASFSIEVGALGGAGCAAAPTIPLTSYTVRSVSGAATQLTVDLDGATYGASDTLPIAISQSRRSVTFEAAAVEPRTLTEDPRGFVEVTRYTRVGTAQAWSGQWNVSDASADLRLDGEAAYPEPVCVVGQSSCASATVTADTACIYTRRFLETPTWVINPFDTAAGDFSPICGSDRALTYGASSPWPYHEWAYPSGWSSPTTDASAVRVETNGNLAIGDSVRTRTFFPGGRGDTLRSEWLTSRVEYTRLWSEDMSIAPRDVSALPLGSTQEFCLSPAPQTYLSIPQRITWELITPTPDAFAQTSGDTECARVTPLSIASAQLVFSVETACTDAYGRVYRDTIGLLTEGASAADVASATHELSVYPNPSVAGHQAWIVVPDAWRGRELTLSVYTATGQLVSAARVRGSERLPLPTSGGSALRAAVVELCDVSEGACLRAPVVR